MWRKPFRIGGIPGKAASKLVINSAIDHFIQGKAGLVQRFLILGIKMILKQKTDGKGLRKLGCCPKTAFLPVSRFHQLLKNRLQVFPGKRCFSSLATGSE